MSKDPFFLEFHPKKSSRRDVAFLTCEGRSAINVYKEFNKLEETEKKKFGRHFDWWVDGRPMKSEQFHPFKGKGSVIVFKIHGHRLYGCIRHPKVDDQSFESCILMVYSKKKKDETNPRDLKKVRDMTQDPDFDTFIDLNYYIEEK